MTHIQLGPVHFDPMAQAYEARVDIRRGDRTFRYPCRVAAPVSADPDTISASLVRQALLMSDSATLH